MNYIVKFLVLLMLPLFASAEGTTSVEDTKNIQNPKKNKRKFHMKWPATGFWIQTDLSYPLMNQYSYNNKSCIPYDLLLGLEISKWSFTFEHGWMATWPLKKLYTEYEIRKELHTTNYLRAGVCYNVLTSTPDHNMFSVGLAYARSGRIHNADFSIDALREQLFYDWFEITVHARTKLIGWIYVGCTFRYQFGLDKEAWLNWYKHEQNNRVHGWSKSIVHGWSNNPCDNENLQFSYYLSLRIPLVLFKTQDPSTTKHTPLTTKHNTPTTKQDPSTTKSNDKPIEPTPTAPEP